jgi:hypothetical protein
VLRRHAHGMAHALIEFVLRRSSEVRG